MAEVQKAALESYNKIKAERGEVTALDMFIAGRDWFKDQMMKDAMEAVVSQVPCANEIIFRNPASVSYWYLPSEMNRLGINKGDKVKVIIIKE